MARGAGSALSDAFSNISNIWINNLYRREQIAEEERRRKQQSGEISALFKSMYGDNNNNIQNPGVFDGELKTQSPYNIFNGGVNGSSVADNSALGNAAIIKPSPQSSGNWAERAKSAIGNFMKRSIYGKNTPLGSIPGDRGYSEQEIDRTQPALMQIAQMADRGNMAAANYLLGVINSAGKAPEYETINLGDRVIRVPKASGGQWAYNKQTPQRPTVIPGLADENGDPATGILYPDGSMGYVPAINSAKNNAYWREYYGGSDGSGKNYKIDSFIGEDGFQYEIKVDPVTGEPIPGAEPRFSVKNKPAVYKELEGIPNYLQDLAYKALKNNDVEMYRAIVDDSGIKPKPGIFHRFTDEYEDDLKKFNDIAKRAYEEYNVILPGYEPGFINSMPDSETVYDIKWYEKNMPGFMEYLNEQSDKW